MFEHYVAFRARPGREDALDEACRDLVDGLADEIAGLEHLSWGRNVNPTGLERGFTHGCLGRFSEEAAFRNYWDHPAHARFAAVLDEICEDRFAIDYLSNADAGPLERGDGS